MKRKILLATLLSLLAILVCSSAFAACSYTWTDSGVTYKCSDEHEYDKGSTAWNASVANGDCRYFIYHFDTTNNKYSMQTVIHSDHNLVIQYDSVQTTATCSTSGNIRRECSYCDYPSITSGKLANQHPSDKLVTETKSATCVDDGYMKITCTACNTVVSNQVTPAHGKHTTASEPRVEKEPTCTDMGMLVDWCTVCDQTLGKNSDIPALGHIGSMSVKQSPSCLTDGYGVLSCSRCKIVLNSNYVISKLGHLPSTNWQTKTVQPYACCAGEEITYCPRCNTTMSSTAVAATADHSWGDWKWSYLESDTSVLTHVKTCSVCGEKKEERCVGTYSMANNGLHDHVFRCSTCGNPAFHNGVGGKATCTSGPICTKCGLAYDEPLGHRNLYTKTVKEATCTVDGLQKTYCGVCDAEVSSTTLKAPGHDPEEYERVEADCCKAGYYKVRCSVCKVDTAGDAIPPTGHNATGATYDKLVEATCTKEGSYTVYCSKYNTVLSSKTLAKTSHTMEDASYAPTCTMAGWSGSKCSVCGYKDPGTFLDPIDHDFTKHTNVKPATCTTDGSYDLVCRVCGTYATTNPIPAFDHTEGAAQTTKAATCCEAGTSSVYCTVCKELVRTETIAATGNHAKEWRVTKEATCTATGVKTLYCATSGKSLGQTQTIAMKSHTEGAAKTTKAATCCESGTAEVRCTVCNTLIRTETLAATEKHAYEWRVMREATCIQQGKRDLYCANSGKYLGDYEYTAFAPHTEGDPVTVQEPTCCKTGLAEIRCTVCDALIDTVTLAAKGHVDIPGVDVEWRVTTEPTCTEDGEETKFCLYTGDSMGETRAIPATGHTEDEPVIVKEPACTVDGLQEIRCAVCNELLRTEMLLAPGHQLSAPITVKEPTCCEAGTAEIRCTVCGEVLETKTLDATGHGNEEGKDYEWRVTKEPTCTEDGVETKYCLNTGDSMGETRAIPAKGHSFGEWQPEPGDETMKYRVCLECGYAEYEYIKIPDEDCAHENVETLPGYAPSCEENGYTQHDFCKDCGAPVTLPTVIPATGHQNLAVIPAVPATPDQPGKTEGLYCADCGKVLVNPQDVNYEGELDNLIVNGLVVNPETGAQIGEVKDNVYTDMGGNVVGTFQPDGTLVDPQGNVIGDLEGNRIYDNGGAHVGTIVDSLEDVEDEDSYIDVDGIVINPTTGEVIGEVNDNVYTDNNGNEIGTFQPDGTLVDPQGNVIGDLDGNLIYDNDGNHVGTIVDGIGAEDFIDIDGTVVDPETGDEIGKVEDNVYTDNEGNEIGTFQPDGSLVDPEGNVIGKLEGDYIYDNDGNHVGTIVDGTLIPGHPDFDLSDYLDEYYSHVEDGEKIRPTIEEEKCEIGSTQDVNGEQTLISGAEDYAICPNDNYPLSQWIPTGDGSHVRVCTCDTCDYSETAACIYFEITVNDTLYKICPICGHFGDKQYEHIRKVNVGVDGHLHELICREYEEPFGADAAKVKNYAEDEAVVIADSFTAVKSVKGELMAWGDAQTLYIPMPNPGEVTLVSMDMEGNFENVPFMYFDGRIAFNADDNALYLIIAK